MGINNKGMMYLALAVFLLSTVWFFKSGPSFALTDVWIDEKELGELCIAQVAPAAGELGDAISAADGEEERTASQRESGTRSDGDTRTEESEEKAGKSEKGRAKKEQKEKKLDVPADPLVIIYHTHSSESYMPYKASNYHRGAEEGTVRDVGNVLEEELEKKGINVIHDKTVHDRPSYNESYTRSLATIQSLVKKYPTACYIIDLHRDAAAASATEGKYLEIDGKRVAKFSMVVGRANDNYPKLSDFANKVSRKAENMYAGFGGYIIEKDYNYNEFVSDKALLLEVGNNKNTIEEARRCGAYFADVLAEIIEEEQQR